jgi:hypothetical protein
MTPHILEVEIGRLQQLPATDDFAAGELAGIELRPCNGRTCWFSCLWTCDVTE